MDSQKNDFQQLTRLLHLKRFEAPPPGFHGRFRARVMTRIEMEREWAEQPWWHRALAALTRQRGLAVANGVALAGVAFLGVATFHVAHTVVNEEDEVQIYAALPLPGIQAVRDSMALPAGDTLVMAQTSTSFSSRTSAVSHSIVVPVSDETAVSGSGSAPSNSSTAPAWLFDPPSNRSRKSAAPRFIFPGGRNGSGN